MRIKLFTDMGEQKESYLNAPFLLKTAHNRTKTSFIFDTGSPTTIISYSDARLLQIPFNNTAEQIIRLGGRKYQSYTYNKLTMVFLSEDNKPIEETMPVTIIKPTSIKDMEEVDSIPTILGMDFLKSKGYKLFCDLANQIAYLEK